MQSCMQGIRNIYVHIPCKLVNNSNLAEVVILRYVVNACVRYGTHVVN